MSIQTHPVFVVQRFLAFCASCSLNNKNYRRTSFHYIVLLIEFIYFFKCFNSIFCRILLKTNCTFVHVLVRWLCYTLQIFYGLQLKTNTKVITFFPRDLHRTFHFFFSFIFLDVQRVPKLSCQTLPVDSMV